MIKIRIGVRIRVRVRVKVGLALGLGLGLRQVKDQWRKISNSKIKLSSVSRQYADSLPLLKS